MGNTNSDGKVRVGPARISDETIRKELPKPNTAISEFKQMDSNALYVDKTLVIKDIIDTSPTAGIFLFTRPRRFGKTFLMSTLKAFFEKPGTAMDVKATEDTARLFQDKKIWSCPEKYREHQGQYPVVYLTFKDAKASTWDDMYLLLCQLLIAEVSLHPEILKSDKCSSADIAFMKKLTEGKLERILVQTTLQVLTRMLAMHWGAPVVVIIDEYDTPLQESYFFGFYDDARRFYGSLLSGGLIYCFQKSNNYDGGI